MIKASEFASGMREYVKQRPESAKLIFEHTVRLNEAKALMMLCYENIVREMSGREFELFMGKLLECTDAYTDVTVTQASADRGGDILATDKIGRRLCIQLKHTKVKPGISAIQEAYTAASFYGADVAAVFTTAPGFTREAEEVARKIGVQLGDINYVTELMDSHIEATMREVHEHPQLVKSVMNSVLNPSGE